MEKILERLKSLGYRLTGYYDSRDTTQGYRCVVMGETVNGGRRKYAVWWANPKTGTFNRSHWFGEDAHHDALNEFCDRCHQLHP